MCIAQHTCEGQRAFWGSSFSSPPVGSGVELSSSACLAPIFFHRFIFLAPPVRPLCHHFSAFCDAPFKAAANWLRSHSSLLVSGSLMQAEETLQPLCDCPGSRAFLVERLDLPGGTFAPPVPTLFLYVLVVSISFLFIPFVSCSCEQLIVLFLFTYLF